MKPFYGQALEPEDVRLLAEAFRRACVDVFRCDDREEIARVLLNAYGQGVRDESLLVQCARIRLARMSGSTRRFIFRQKGFRYLYCVSQA